MTADDKDEGGAALTQWRRVWPLAGLALAAVVNVLWVGGWATRSSSHSRHKAKWPQLTGPISRNARDKKPLGPAPFNFHCRRRTWHAICVHGGSADFFSLTNLTESQRRGVCR